ncbi:MAG: MraY family glycosyltransferase [candidate division WOR-3 bacterium]
MINIFSLIFSFIFPLFLTISFTPIVFRIGKNLKIMDYPYEERKIHKHPVPRTGGIAVALSVFITFLFLLKENFVYYILLFSLFFLIFGFIDDAGLRLRNIYKWIIAFFIVLTFFMLTPLRVKELGDLLGFGNIKMNFITSLIFSLFAITSVINSFNLIDGMDGLLASVSFISSLAFAFLNYKNSDFYLSFLWIGLAGASLGFLFYNFHPAKIFLGDAGSLFIGSFITFLSVLSAKGNFGNIKPIQCVLILSLPISDMIWVVLRRIFYKKSIFDPDLLHLHYRILKKINSQRKTLFILSILSIIFSLEAIIFEKMPDYILFIIFWINFLIVGFMDRIFKQNKN